MSRLVAAGTLLCVVLLAGLSDCAQPQRQQHSLHARDAHHQLLSSAKERPRESFASWLERHGKAYKNDLKEMEKRFAIWLQNLEYILEYNAKTTTHWLGLNSLADLTKEEYAQRYLGYNHASKKQLKAQHRASNAMPNPFRYADVPQSSLPASIDWRELNAVSEVKNQAQCGSCWAFSTTGSVEGINAIVTKKLLSASEQELVDCDTEEDKGCGGGLMDYAYQFIMENGGIDTEEDYPYTATEGECEAIKLNKHALTIDGFEDVPENNEAALKAAVAHQPVSVAIEADQQAFQLYMGGVFADETCGTELDHGVLVVGYGTDPETNMGYWIVKNSWGPEWGEQGYIRLQQGVTAQEGLCGIAMAASYPTKEGGPDPRPTPGPTPGPSPKPPQPEPVQCDSATSCPPETTCCCVTDFLGMCLEWGCCPVMDAVCCDDHEHCCTPELPVCDTESGRCGTGEANGATQPWLTKIPATRHWPRWVPWSHTGSGSSKEDRHG
mmetsp:Transcript_15277/g.40293  ORF Transcript_15277/g.40293 Transcript_15277/m.40293 type:complete len:496 (-) Transcript_15277:1023-2510(-)